MTGIPSRDYEEIARQAKIEVAAGKIEPLYSAIAVHFDVPRETLRLQFTKMKITTDVLKEWARGYAVDQDDPTLYDQEAILEFTNVKEQKCADWREILEVAQKVKDLNGKYDRTQRIAEVTIHSDAPAAAIMFTSDWHLGDMCVDYKTWERDIQYVLDTDNLFMIDMGDDRQNMRSFKNLASVLNQALSPKLQATMLRGVVDEMTAKNKLLAKVDGNHDTEFDERIFGESLQSYLLEKMNAPRFRNRGVLKVHFGEQTYYLLMFHKSRFKSFLRGTHGNYREYELSIPADIVAGGHDHVPALEWISHYTLANQAGMDIGGGAWLIKTGTYQDSDFGYKYFHNGGYQVCFTALLFKDRKYIQVLNSAQHAMALLNAL